MYVNELLKCIDTNILNLNKEYEYKITNMCYSIENGENPIEPNNNKLLKFLKSLGLYNRDMDTTLNNGDLLHIQYNISSDVRGNYITLKKVSKSYVVDNLNIHNSQEMNIAIHDILKQELDKYNFERSISNKISSINKHLMYCDKSNFYDLDRISMNKINNMYVINGYTVNKSRLELLFLKNEMLSTHLMNELVDIKKFQEYCNNLVLKLKYHISDKANLKLRSDLYENIPIITNSTFREYDNNLIITTNIEYILNNKLHNIIHNDSLSLESYDYYNLNDIFGNISKVDSQVDNNEYNLQTNTTEEIDNTIEDTTLPNIDDIIEDINVNHNEDGIIMIE